MTPSIAHASHFASTPTSPGGFAPDSDGDEDINSVLSFSSSRSKQRRDERRQTAASLENVARTDPQNGSSAASASGASTQAQASLSRRRRSGSAGSVRQLLRPRTPINSAAARDPQSQPHHLSNGNASVLSEAISALPSTSIQTGAEDTAQVSVSPRLGPNGDHVTSQFKPNASRSIDLSGTNFDADSPSPPVSPTSDSTQPESPFSVDSMSNSNRVGSNGHASVAADGKSENGIPETKPASDDSEEEFPLVLKLLLHPLRILAVVPGCIGTYWLARNAWVLATRHGHLLSPGQMLISANGTNHFWSAGLSEPPVSGAFRLGRRQPGSLDFAVACLWSMSTAYHALSFTTLLLRRWLLYYSILPSLIRLVALQAICWPLVRLTVHVFGVDQPLGAWVVIGTTTALSDVVSRWVTSNIADAPLDDELDEEEEEEEMAAENEALGYLSDSRFIRSHLDPIQLTAYSMLINSRPPRTLLETQTGTPGRATRAMQPRPISSRQSVNGRENNVGEVKEHDFGVQSLVDPLSPLLLVDVRLNVLRHPHLAQVQVRAPRRNLNLNLIGPATALIVLSSAAAVAAKAYVDDSATPFLLSHLPHLRINDLKRSSNSFWQTDHSPSLPSELGGGQTRFTYRSGAWERQTMGRKGRDRTNTSRRNFHWEVAVWRNVVPIAVLAYLSMWILILDAMRVGN